MIKRYDCELDQMSYEHDSRAVMEEYIKGDWVSYEDYKALEAKVAEQAETIERLRREKTEQYQLAQYYRTTLQEIRDKTPANQHKKWPHHHWYLVTASDAINHKLLEAGK